MKTTLARSAPLRGGFLAALGMTLLASCSFFSRSQSRYYSLDSIAPAQAVAAKQGAPMAIDAIELPPGFDRREVVVMKADHQLDIRSTQQWSANLSELVLHTLAFDLAKRLPEGMIVLPGEPRPAAAIRSIDVAFEQLAAGPEAKVVLDARWTLGLGASHHERIEIDIKSLDSAEVATGMSQAIAALADSIAAQM
jgi:uncharacterized lipoprotein YmbA